MAEVIPEYLLSVETLVIGGDGLARDPEGRVVFVPGTAPGDRVRVRMTDRRRSFARAEVTALEVSGPGRVPIVCPAFAARTCGGCQWLHLSAETQAEAKIALVQNALRAQIAQGLELQPLERPSPVLGWRRRARLSWIRTPKSAAAVLGFFAPSSHRITDIEVCVQLSPPLQRVLAAIRKLLPALRDRGEILLLEGENGAVDIAIRGPVDPRALDVLMALPEVSGVSCGKERRGAPGVMVESGGQGSALHFEQASIAGNVKLREIVEQWTRPRAGARILELYAGSGNFTRLLCDQAAEVVAVERHSDFPKLRNVTWMPGDVTGIVTALARKGQAFDQVVLDPPRTGAKEVLPALLLLAPARIVYVSCDLATLARDLELLTQSGYRADKAVPLDLMPQTAQIEVVTALSRR